MPNAIHKSEEVASAASLELLGLSALRGRDFDRAASLFARAIGIAGPKAGYCGHLGASLLSAGRFRQAAACYEQAIAGNPNNIRFYLNLARALVQDGRAADAVTPLKRALTLMPECAEAWALLGGAMNLSGQVQLAAEALRQAVDLDAGQASYHFDLGLVLFRLGDLAGSEAAYRHALLVNPQFPEALNNLGNLLRRNNDPAEAVACFERALSAKPDYADARYNLGLALQSLDLLDDAEACYRHVLEEAPGHHAASNNHANVLMGLGRVQEALPRYEHAVRLAPKNREYRINAAMAQLLDGDFREGWRNYASRAAPVVAGARLWNGEHLRGSSILLLSEQGLGDTIQFIRYARFLHLEGARVQAFCPPELAELLSSAAGLECVVTCDRTALSCEWYAPLLHLPAVFGTRVGTIPNDAPYLSADPSRVREWSAWFSEKTSSVSELRVGLAWRGGPDHRNDHNRSMDPAWLAGLRAATAVKFFSLQKGLPGGCDGLDFTPLPRDFANFADTAALMMHLDLIISVDTSVAHLAGALARPAWLLLPFAPDWRWMLGRDDTPWYPNMRLFRQHRRGDWGSVMNEVRDALMALVRT